MAKCILSTQALNRGHTPKILCNQPSIIYRDLWKNIVGHDMSSNVVSFRPPGRHNIFLFWRHDQRHVADMSPTRHTMSANEGSGRHDTI